MREKIQQEINDELAKGILKSTANVLLSNGKDKCDPKLNLTNLVHPLDEEIRRLSQEKSPGSGILASLRAHIRAKEMIRGMVKNKVIFTHVVLFEIAIGGALSAGARKRYGDKLARQAERQRKRQKQLAEGRSPEWPD